MTDLGVYVVLGAIIPALLILGIALRDEIVRHLQDHHHHNTPFTV